VYVFTCIPNNSLALRVGLGCRALSAAARLCTDRWTCLLHSFGPREPSLCEGGGGVVPLTCGAHRAWWPSRMPSVRPHSEQSKREREKERKSKAEGREEKREREIRHRRRHCSAAAAASGVSERAEQGREKERDGGRKQGRRKRSAMGMRTAAARLGRGERRVGSDEVNWRQGRRRSRQSAASSTASTATPPARQLRSQRPWRGRPQSFAVSELRLGSSAPQSKQSERSRARPQAPCARARMAPPASSPVPFIGAARRWRTVRRLDTVEIFPR
jgi:hypothetical protein